MDVDRFGSLARAVRGVASRRLVTRALVRLSLAGALGVAGLEDAAARRCGPCLTRRNGRCRRDRPDDTPCKSDGRCLNGRCNPAPTCKGFRESCFFHFECCGGSCLGPLGCDDSATGGVCRVDRDCAEVCHGDGTPCDRPNDCIGYRCKPPPA